MWDNRANQFTENSAHYQKIVEKALTQIQEGNKPKIDDIIREMAHETEDVQKNDAVKVESIDEEKTEKPTTEQSQDDLFLEGVGGCDVWGGPWVCTYCTAWLTTVNVFHSPVACPGCGKSDGIKRRTDVDVWKPLIG